MREKDIKDREGRFRRVSIARQFSFHNIEASIGEQETSSWHVRSVHHSRKGIESSISRFDETSKTTGRFIAFEVDSTKRRVGSFFIIPP